MATAAATTTRSVSTPPTPKAIGGFRADLEGLRAIAVLAVAADHLIHFPTGGFVGVDIFFVLSGFLITGLLLREVHSSGRISFADFYRRRVRRILPAALVVLVITVSVAYLVFRAGRAGSIAQDAFWAAIFLSNWRSAFTGTDYMHAGSAASPIQHYWSLGVEEQFYVFWPILLLLVLWIGSKLFRRGEQGQRVGLGILFSVVIVASYIFSIVETHHQAAFAYFDTFGRGWELALGALAALLMPFFAKMPQALRWVLGGAGLAIVVASVFLLTPAAPFPGPWAAAPVAGAVLLVIAGIGSAKGGYSDRFHILTNPVARYIGKISFSLYLWHFPVIILLEPLLGQDRALFYGISVVTMIGLSVLSFHMIEDPIRRSNWLEPKRRIAGRRVKEGAKLASVRLAIAAVAVLAVVGTAVYSQVSEPRTTPSAAPSPAPVSVPPVAVDTNSPSAEPSSVPEPNPQVAQTAAIQSALGATSWPDNLNPSLDQFANAGEAVKAPQWVKDGCLGTNESQVDDPIANAQHCVYGDPNGKHTLVVYGDSMDISYVPGLIAALAGQSWKIYVYTVAGCPVAAVNQTQIGGAPFPQCDQFRNWAINRIGELKPDLVVLSEYRYDPVLISKATGAAADAERAAGYHDTLNRLAQVTNRMMLLSAPPEGKLLAECATRFSTPADCLASPTAQYQRNIGIEQSQIDQVNAEHPGMKATYVPTEPWFCIAGKCPAFIGTAPIHADQYHMTAAGSQEVAPLLAYAMRQALRK